MAWPTLARTAGRLPGSRFRDDLARLATHGTLDAHDLIELARRSPRTGISDFDPRGLAWFGHLVASEMESADHATDAAAVFELAYRVGGRRAMGRDLDGIWVQCLALSGRLSSFRSALRGSIGIRDALWAADTDALLPPPQELHDGVDHRHPQHQEWWTALNRPLADVGLEPLTIEPGDGHAFDRIACAVPAEARVTDGPLISVVVPVYNPGPSLRTTVSSLIGQTWRSIEILLCDDASTTGADMFAEMVAADPRVRHLRAPHNGGTYAARNLGIGAAAGEYVTFNDADDWSHPRRLERQYAAIGADPEARASLSWCVRIKEDLSLTVMGRPPSRVNLSSILFRREDVLRSLGGFDALRKGADSEFVERFRVRFGSDSITEIRDPLALVQLTGGSLSRDDYRFLRTHPARLQYMSAFRHWHHLLAQQPARAYLAPGTRAPFPAPGYLLGSPVQHTAVDVLVCANLTPDSPTSVDLAAEVAAARSAGLSVGLLETLAPLDLTASIRHPSGPIAEEIHAGVTRLLPGAPADVRLLVIRDPAGPGAMPPEHFAGVRADTALVVADHGPDDGRSYDPPAVEQRLADAVGVRQVRWLPATAAIAESLAAHGARGQVLEPGHFTVAPRDTPVPSLGSSGAEAPSPLVVGVVARSPRTDADHPRSWEAQVAELPADTRLLGWGAQGPGVGRDRITHLSASQVALTTFLRLVDVVVVPFVPMRGPVVTRAVAGALTAGKVVLLEPAYRQVLGEAALYSDEHSLASLPELAAEGGLVRQQQRAISWAQAHLGDSIVRAHLTRALEAPSDRDSEES